MYVVGLYTLDLAQEGRQFCWKIWVFNVGAATSFIDTATRVLQNPENGPSAATPSEAHTILGCSRVMRGRNARGVF